MRSRRAIPPRLLEPPPEVNIGLELYMKAFWDLCSDRYEEGRRIPWTAIQWWCEAKGVEPGEEQDDVHFLVNRLDMAFLQWQQKKSKTPPPKKTRDERDPGRVR